jgi:outer membrane protein assembly factor BamA
LLLTSYFILLASLAAAQIGEPITEVRLDQEGRPVADPLVTGLVETRVGEPLSMRDVRETTTHLMSLGRFEDVRSYAEPAPGGIRVRYELVPLHPVDRVVFEGSLGISDDDLRRVIQERFGAAPPAARAGDVVSQVRAEYRSRGYPDAAITTRIVESHNPDRASMVIAVNPGRRATVAAVKYVVTDEGDPSAAIGVPVVREGRPYDEREIDGELQEWVERMRDRGYYAARASHGASFADGAYVTVTLRRGPRVVIAFSGDALPEDERERLVPIRAEASADEDLLEDSVRAIERYFFDGGYRDARATYMPVEKGGELVITFDIRRGPRYRVDDLSITGHTALSTVELRELVPLAPGDFFVQARLDQGVAAVTNSYRRLGYTEVTIKPTTAVLAPENPRAPERAVDVALAIVEGPRTLVRAVTFSGHTAVTETELRRLVAVVPGRPYSDGDVTASRDQLELEYQNRGFDGAVVNPDVTRAEGNTQADIAFRITEGQQTIVDHIIILGNERTNTDTIERELLLRTGEPLGYAALIESRARVMALGLFSSVQIEPVAQSGQGGRRDVIVRVQEAPPNSIGFGGGLEGGYLLRPTGAGGVAEERFELAPRGFFEIGRRNLWGKNRSVNLFTRVSLRSRDVVLTDSGLRLLENTRGFNEYRVIGTFREPRVFGTVADAQIVGILEQAIRSSFNFTRRELRGEALTQLAPGYSVAARYSFQRTKLFDEKFTAEDEPPLIDRLFPEIRLSKIAGSFIRDTRDDLVDTAGGTLLIVDGDVAARAIGSEVGFLRSYVQGFAFRQLPTARRVIAAFAVRVGAAHGFARDVPAVDEDGRPVLGPDGTQVIETVQDLPASERFFAGGDTSVRGFSLDRLGNAETIGEQTGFPTGGNSVVVLNAELRVNVASALQVVGFLDAGNVFPRASDLDFMDLRPAAGTGLRYRSPVGPVRFDLGFNLNPRELVPGTPERRAVFHISLGQAF